MYLQWGPGKIGIAVEGKRENNPYPTYHPQPLPTSNPKKEKDNNLIRDLTPIRRHSYFMAKIYCHNLAQEPLPRGS